MDMFIHALRATVVQLNRRQNYDMNDYINNYEMQVLECVVFMVFKIPGLELCELNNVRSCPRTINV